MASIQTDQPPTEQAKQAAQQAGQQARGQVRDQVDQRSTQIGDQATSAADAVRQASQQLREQGNEPVAKGMESIAQRVDSAGNWLRDSDGDKILGDVEDFGRRQPWAVLAGAATIGFALSRLLKASSSRRYEQSRATYPRTTPGYGARFERSPAIPETTSPATTPTTAPPVPPPTVPPTGGVTETLGAERR